jgi:uncharacterized protein (TIGR02996 family)
VNEDAAFIRALREQPDDETTRLVYADWLNDRSDPRGEYLRAEAAWVALQPPAEQYRPLYRRVSQLAAALDPEWFVAVSRMRHLARCEWFRVSHVWESLSRARDYFATEWHIARQDIESTLHEVVGRDATDRRFCVPADYLAFMLSVGGGWLTNDERHQLLRGEHIANLTDVPLFAPVPNDQLEIWIDVALSGDHHRFLLCCDLDCPRFGEVAEGEDYHPWMDSGSAPLRTRGTTFLHFLANWPARA